MSIVQALSDVMGEVRSVGKGERNTQQNFNYRGIDAVMNAVGPALRNRGVVVVPEVLDIRHDLVEVGSKRTLVTRCIVTVAYTFLDAEGDSLRTVSVGESMDVGDKSTPKAMSVAFRTCLLQALCLPTDDPDPDSQTYQVAHQDLVAKVTEVDTSRVTRGRPTSPDRGGWSHGQEPTWEATAKQLKKIGAMFGQLGVTDRRARLERVCLLVARPLDSSKELTSAEASRVIDALQAELDQAPVVADD